MLLSCCRRPTGLLGLCTAGARALWSVMTRVTALPAQVLANPTADIQEGPNVTKADLKARGVRPYDEKVCTHAWHPCSSSPAACCMEMYGCWLRLATLRFLSFCLPGGGRLPQAGLWQGSSKPPVDDQVVHRLLWASRCRHAQAAGHRTASQVDCGKQRLHSNCAGHFLPVRRVQVCLSLRQAGRAAGQVHLNLWAGTLSS